jgi:DNA-binding HxlR family transcriptional regulator
MKKDLFGICPYTTAQKILSGKWTVLILYYLSLQTMRFNELQRTLPDLTQTTLSKQLRNMEQAGLITRKVFEQIPPKVEYSLSEIGRQFVPVLESLEIWGDKYIAYMQETQDETYDIIEK